MMKERPILFSGPMVVAILDGRKTMTRRAVKLPAWSTQDWNDFDPDEPSVVCKDTGCMPDLPCPYGKVGDRLWVREAFYCNDYRYPDAPPAELLEEITYRADHESPCRCEEPIDGHWKPSIHMPRWASRINLEITGVRVERLNGISATDAETELGGISHYYCEDGTDDDPFPAHRCDVQRKFQELWDKINGKKHPWASNPWVWCVSFRRVDNAS